MKRTVSGSDVLLWILLGTAISAATVTVVLALIYSAEYDFFFVPFAAWFVFALLGLLLILAGLALYFWRQYRHTSRALAETRQTLTGLSQQPFEDQLPVVWGHKQLDQPEFLAIIQMLFRRPPAINYVHVQPLPGGYGGSATVLARLQRRQDASLLPRSFVIKLGARPELADEYDRFQNYVLATLTNAAHFFRHARSGDYAGIAYEFVGLDPDHEIQSFYQFYQGYTLVEITGLIEEIFLHLGRAWYQRGQIERVNLYHEYDLLSRKNHTIIGHIGEMVDEDDPYRYNFTAIQDRLRPNLKPCFCPKLDLPWSDPVAFLRLWPNRNLTVPIRRSIVHGDLNARNILVEMGADGQRRIWFIDFSHTGNGLSGARTAEARREGLAVQPDRGHSLRDFCRLEADTKFILTRLYNEDDLRLAVLFEQAVLAEGLALGDWPVSSLHLDILKEDRFRKAWHVIKKIRSYALDYLANPDDLRPYYLSLLHATLPIVYYRSTQFESAACERQQKRFALISAGMLCHHL
ncbi:MAG: lipopolysaccharide kinase InaA family protein [Chloroflexota bacterium]